MVLGARRARTLALAAFAGLASFACADGEPERAPDIVLVLADTLRADHLGFHGYARPTSPTLDAFARDNLVFAQAVSAAPWTSPSVASLFTGLYPTAHGVVRSPQGDEVPTDALASGHTTLAEQLARAGYTTAAISANPWVSAARGYAQGFDRFAERSHLDASALSALAREWILELAQQPAPFFLYLHYMDPHLPNEPPAALVDRFHPAGADRKPPRNDLAKLALTIAAYDAEVFALDQGIAALFAALREAGRSDDTVIAFVADHGEQIFDHGEYGHGHALFGEEIHVPLLLAAGSQRGTVTEPVSTIDLAPTLLALAGAPPLPGAQGVSLLDTAALRARGGAYSEATMRHNQKAFVATDGAKLIVDFPKRAQALVDPQSPVERVALLGARSGLAGPRPELADEARAATLERALRATYAESLARGRAIAPAQVELDDATRAELEALGYGVRDTGGDAGAGN